MAPQTQRARSSTSTTDDAANDLDACNEPDMRRVVEGDAWVGGVLPGQACDREHVYYNNYTYIHACDMHTYNLFLTIC
jgi:hypothetical protein